MNKTKIQSKSSTFNTKTQKMLPNNDFKLYNMNNKKKQRKFNIYYKPT